MVRGPTFSVRCSTLHVHAAQGMATLLTFLDPEAMKALDQMTTGTGAEANAKPDARWGNEFRPSLSHVSSPFRQDYSSRHETQQMATAPEEPRNTKPVILGVLEDYRHRMWWAGAESNCRHRDFQSRALQTELPARGKPRET